MGRAAIALAVMGSLLTGGLQSASARTFDAPPPLSASQLVALRHVPAWDVTFHKSYTGHGSWSAPTVTSPVTSSASSFSFDRSSDARFTITTDGSDCALIFRVGCRPDFTLPMRVAFADQASEISTTHYNDGCALDDEGNLGPGVDFDSRITDATGSLTEADLNPAEVSGSLFIIYGADQATFFGGISTAVPLENDQRVEATRCNLPPSRQPPGHSNDYSPAPVLIDSASSTQMPISVVDGLFQSSGTYTVTHNGCREVGCFTTQFTDITDTMTLTWSIREPHGPRMQSVPVQQPDIPSGTMRAVPASGTFDG